ncbi:MAG TPA: hypothetical protein VK663_15330 [Burkholderiales bacterium]|nr:hypothetical protein [Burkholderiales bacterium]
MMKKLILITLATAFAANVAIAQTVTQANGVLADATGRTLYTFDKDAANKSNCYGGCAAAWPPFIAKESDRPISGYNMVTRDDGAKQWALNGKPLYYFAADANAGEIKGDGQGGVWHAVRGADKRAEAQPAAVKQTSGSYGSYGSNSGY